MVHSYNIKLLSIKDIELLIDTTTWMNLKCILLRKKPGTKDNILYVSIYMIFGIYAYTHTHTHTHIHIYTHIYVYIWMCVVSQLLGRLRQEDLLSPGGQGCGELWSGHCTPAWVTEWEPVSKNKLWLLQRHQDTKRVKT